MRASLPPRRAGGSGAGGTGGTGLPRRRIRDPLDRLGRNGEQFADARFRALPSEQRYVLVAPVMDGAMPERCGETWWQLRRGRNTQPWKVVNELEDASLLAVPGTATVTAIATRAV